MKNALFDILSLVNQFYKSKWINLDSFDIKKIYFPENHIFNLLKGKNTNLYYAINLYNNIIIRNKVLYLISAIKKEDIQILKFVE